MGYWKILHPLFFHILVYGRFLPQLSMLVFVVDIHPPSPNVFHTFYEAIYS